MPLIALALLAAAPATCSLTQPDACLTTAELLAAPGATDAIRAVVGGQRANLLSDGLPPVADQALAVLGGEADKPQRIGGAWLFTACRQDACGEKGAVVVDAAGKIAAVGVVHGACGVEVQKPGCGRRLSLSLYGGDAMVRYRRAIVEWAEKVSDAGRLDVYEDGINEPVIAIEGEFDGDRLPDRAAVVANAGGQGYRLEVVRGADPRHRALVTAVSDPNGFQLAQGDHGTLRFGPNAAMQARWAGDHYVTGK
ncbi:hypothetical protein ACU5AX_01250 [Sphingomonas sp. XXL09]|uniref:hypothetical protein n=1 Tax=Sphingomonas sp. XXL09 TaxID=3457787 RepID=UPI00406BB15A